MKIISTFFKFNFLAGFFLTFTFVFVFNPAGYAQTTYTSNAVTGNWNVGTSWVGGTAPGGLSTDIIVIVSGANITCTSTTQCGSITLNAAATANSLTINSGVTLTTGAVTLNQPSAAVISQVVVGSGTLSCASIAIPGSATASHIAQVTLNGGIINCSGNITFSGTTAEAKLTLTSGTLNIQGNLGGGGTFAGGTSTVNFNGTTAQTAGGTAAYIYSSVTIDNTAGVTLGFAATIASLTIGDVTTNSVFNDGGFVITPAAPKSLNINSGTYNLGSATVGTAFPGWTTPTINTGTTVAYVSAVAQTVAAVAGGYQYLTFSGAGTKTVATTTTVNLNWAVNSPATTAASTTVLGDISGTGAITMTTGTINIGGNWTNSGVLVPGTTATVNFNGGGAQSINTSLASMIFNNVTLNNSGGSTLIVAGSTTTLQVNTLTLTSGTFVAGTATQINVKASWTNNEAGANFTPGTGTVSFTGAAAQTIGGTTGDQEFYNVILFQTTASTLAIGGSTTTFTINNYTQTTGSFTFTKLTSFTINGSVLLSSGTFTSGAVNITNMPISVVGSWTNNSAAAAFVPSQSIVTFTGSSQTIGGNAATTFYILVIADGAGITLNGSSGIGITCTALTIGNGNSGTLSAGAQPITVSGSAAANGYGYDGITINGGGTLNGNTSTITDKWDFINGGTFNAGTGTVAFSIANVSGNLTKAITGNNPDFYNLTMTGAGTAEILDASQISPINVTNNVTLTTGTFNAPGQIIVGGNWSKATAAVFTTNNGLVTFNGSGAQAITGNTPQSFYDIEVGNTGTLTVTNAFVINILDQLTIDASATLTSGTTATINITNQWNNNGGTFNPSSGTVTFNGSSGNNSYITTNGGSPSQTFNNLIVATTNGTLLDAYSYGPSTLTVNGIFTLTSGGIYCPATVTIAGNVVLTAGFLYANSQINVGGNWTNNGIAGILDYADWCGCNGVVNFDGAAAQSIAGTATSQTFQDITVNKSGAGAAGTLTVSTPTTLTINDNLTLTAGSFTDALASGIVNVNNNGSASSFTLTAGTFTMSGATGNLNINGPGSYTAGTFSSSGTVTYSGSNLVVPGTYNNLTFDNNGKTLSPGTISISGTFTAGTGTGYTTTGNTISLTGSTSQAIPNFNYDGSSNIDNGNDFGYNNLTTTTAKVLPTTNLAINGVLSYDGGNVSITLGSMNLLLGPTGSIAGMSATKYVVYSGTGRMIKAFSTGAQTYTYPIGIGANYLPVTISFDNITQAGEIGISMPVTPAVDPNAVAPPATATNWLKDYWVVDDNNPINGLSTIEFDYYSLTVNYLASAYNTNLTAGAGGESTMGAMIFQDGVLWTSSKLVSRPVTALNPTVSNITTFGDVTFATCTSLTETTAPTNEYICSTSASGNVTFSVAFTGTPSAYQWYQNGVALTNGGIYSGVNSPSLTLTGATTALVGDSYYVSVTGECSGSFSTSANLVYLSTSTGTPSAITSVTASPSTYEAGTTVSFTASPTASNPVGTTYLFEELFPQSYNGPGFGYSLLETSPTLTINNISAYGTSIKSPGVTWTIVIPESACGNGGSNLFLITVIPPTTTVNPTTCGGTNGSISFAGLIVSNQYTVNYSFNNVVQSQLTLTTNASGVLTMPNLGAGTYSNIVLQVLGQGSSSPSAPADPITLTGPCGATAYNVTYNNGTSTAGAAVTVCPGIANIGLINSTVGVTYNLYEGATSVSTYSPSSSGAFNFSYTPLGGKTYTVTGTSSSTTTMTGSVIVNVTPTVNTVTSQTVCNSGSTAAISFSGTVTSPATVYSWSNGTTSIGLGASGTGNISSFSATNSGTSPVTATITVTPQYTNNSVTCNGSTISPTITVNPTPTVNSVTNQTVCNGGGTTALSFTGTVSGTVYSWSNNATSIGLAGSGTGNISSFSGANSGTSPVTATITVTPQYTNNSVTCNGSTMIPIITVNPTPTVNSVTNQTVCNSGSTGALNFSGAVSGSVYSWSNSATTIGLTAGGTGNISSFTAANSGTSLVTATITVTPEYTNNSVTCNGSTINPTITVNPTPTVNSATSQTICNSGSTGALNFSGVVVGTVYNWSNSATSIGLAASGTGNISSFTAANSGASPVTATITVTPQYTNNSVTCNGSTISPAITVNPIPTVIAVPSNPTICSATGAGIGLSNNTTGGTNSWTWTGTNGTNISGAANSSGTPINQTLTNSDVVPQTATYVITPTFTYQSVGCSGSTLTQTVAINPLPTVTAIATPSNLTICSGIAPTIDLSDNTTGGTNSWTWTGTNGANINGASNSSGSVINQTLTNSTNTVNGTATYVITPTFTNNVSCIGSTLTQTVTVLPLPAVSVTPADAVCTGQTNATLTASGTVGNTYTWSPSTFLNTTTGTTVTAQISIVTEYTATAIGSNGCTANSNVVPVATVPSGGAIIPAATVICSGGATTLTSAGAAGHDYQWQISPDNVNWSNIGGATGISYTTTGETTNEYYRLLANSNACYSIASNSSTVDISVTPTVTITSVTSTTVTVTWTPFGSGQYNISWSGNAGSGSASALTSNSFVVGQSPTTALIPNEDLLVTITPATTPACSGVNAASMGTHTLCGSPTVTNVSATASHGFVVDWIAVTGATAYRVYYRDLSNSTSWSFVDVTGGATSVTITANAATYAVYVAAKDCPATGNIGDASTPVNYVTTNPVPSCGPPPTVSTVSNCPNQITVSISGSGPPYNLILRRISPSLTAGVSYPISTSAVNVTIGTQYAGSTWEIFATQVCNGGISAASNISDVTVKPACPVVNNLVLSHPTCNGFTASWNTSDCAGLGISKYELLIKRSNELNYAGYPVSSQLNYEAVTWEPGNTTYDVVVMAVACNDASSGYSNEQTISSLNCGREGVAEDANSNATGNTKESVTVYPNPAQGQFYLDIGRTDMSEAGVKIELLNELGQVVETSISQISGGHLSQLISTPEGLATGIYFVRTSVGNNVYVNRIMITGE